MTEPQQPGRGRGLTRAELPAELTPETVRRLSFPVLRRLARHDNGILTPAEQEQFDEAFAVVGREIREHVRGAEGRIGRGGPRGLDPEMRRSYARTQQRLAEQARRTREALPDLDWHPAPPEVEEPARAPQVEPDTDETSVDSLSDDLEETSTTLELLDRIATIQQQQLEHQESQLLLDTRGFFFAFLVSVSVIVAGVAPLVEAEPHERWLIVVWTVVAIAVAGLVYGGVRLAQRRGDG